MSDAEIVRGAFCGWGRGPAVLKQNGKAKTGISNVNVLRSIFPSASIRVADETN